MIITLSTDRAIVRRAERTVRRAARRAQTSAAREIADFTSRQDRIELDLMLERSGHLAEPLRIARDLAGLPAA